MDFLTPAERSKRMSSIRGADTGPERKLAEELGQHRFRFVMHAKDLLGKPDFVFKRSRVAVFLHGCYWHGHSCQKGRIPATNSGFWAQKFQRNQARDRRVSRALRSLGWCVLTVWECRIRPAAGCSSEARRIISYVRSRARTERLQATRQAANYKAKG
jgi:DNA mismatch endonuclease (patch repair protein)